MERYDQCYQAQIDGVFRTLPRSKYTYRNFSDNIKHTVLEKETLFTIAGKYYKGTLPRPTMWYWVIADFQPTPIIDVTRVLTPGMEIIVPSPNTVLNKVLSASRFPEFETW